MDSLTVLCKNMGKTKFCGAARGHEMYCDITPDRGGTDAAMLPPESLLASLGNCVGMAIALTCENKGIPYEGMEVTVTAEYADEGHRVDNFRCEIKMPEPLDDRQRAIVKGAMHLCKVGNTLAHGAKVEEVVL
ncbi:MAG: OsmC family protein [candidate division WS1 bacterium]|nr:OsmC family protein [candidate division WS1 bacterium]